MAITRHDVSAACARSTQRLRPRTASRTSARWPLSVVGLYWAIGIFLSPLLFGFLAEQTSIATSIYIFSGFAIAAGLLSPLLYDFGRRGLPPEGEEEEAARSAT